jgi:hypothetical protein
MQPQPSVIPGPSFAGFSLEDRDYRIEDCGHDTPCWIYARCITPKGYGTLSVKVNGSQTTRPAHRLAYLLLAGPIPEGMQPDHLCRNPACINPAHLEVVTPRENTLRGEGPTAQNARATHCKHGHELTPDNVYVHPNGRWRTCRTCWRAHKRAIRARRKDRARASLGDVPQGSGSRASVRHLWDEDAPWTLCGQRTTAALLAQTVKAARDCKNCLKIKRQREDRNDERRR